MQILVQGHETSESIAVLLKLTRINSKNKIDALTAHLVDGLPPNRAYWRYQVSQQHFSEALAKLNATADLALQFQEQKKQLNNKNIKICGYQPTDRLTSPPGDD
ncbi:adhesin biosynthesis transcription regulatory family protein [Shewanella abyssi]|uniref:adhesin biosynthesis transcription regulatory family protein n=1 Tax=Shewanella abyssi TaxID=311789 RepID=UPI00200C8B76|nr:adhesin biosynthesis transcription regulatory family protein [Shewanella abyssi]MCL1050369.1 adhesin biosynthesis transcription regulatory family protein [Shewanella abyssi]